MAERHAFVVYLLDMLREFGRVAAQPMFRGYGLFYQEPAQYSSHSL